MANLLLSGTWQDRGNALVQTAPKTASTVSKPVVYQADLVGCGGSTHVKFQRSLSINELVSCQITNVGFLSISGGVRNDPFAGTNYDNMVDTILAGLRAAVLDGTSDL